MGLLPSRMNMHSFRNPTWNTSCNFFYRFGWFGLDRQEVPNPVLNYVGTAGLRYREIIFLKPMLNLCSDEVVHSTGVSITAAPREGDCDAQTLQYPTSLYLRYSPLDKCLFKRISYEVSSIHSSCESQCSALYTGNGMSYHLIII